MSDLTLPRRGRGRISFEAQEHYDARLAEWCASIKQIASRLDFKVSSRGWCYILEEHGLEKGDFDRAQLLINDCRKSGDLPLCICSEDGGRAADNLEGINDEDPEECARDWFEYLKNRAHLNYTPTSFWENQEYYVEMTVEKIDLKSLFADVCAEFRVPIANVSGWNDINSRAAMMRRFQFWEERGKQCVLLHCGDHDPGGLHISDFVQNNLRDLRNAVGWCPNNLTVDRFGLNADFIEQHGLTWIDNLITGSGGRLDDPEHNDHGKPYVQWYLREFGARKVEANALVTRPALHRPSERYHSSPFFRPF